MPGVTISENCLSLGFDCDLNRQRAGVAFFLLVGGLALAMTPALLLCGVGWAASFIVPPAFGCFFVLAGVLQGMQPCLVQYQFNREAGRASCVYHRPFQRSSYTEEIPLSQFLCMELVGRRAEGDNCYEVCILTRSEQKLPLSSFWSYREAAELAKQIGDFLAFIPIADEAEAYYMWGNVHYDQGDCHSAVEDYTRAIKLRPKYADAYLNRGLAYDEQGLHTRALEDFNLAVQLMPDRADAYLYRGLAYRSAGKPGRAATNFRKVLDLADDAELREKAEAELRQFVVRHARRRAHR